MAECLSYFKTANSYPQRGPPLERSKTWCGFSSFLKLDIKCTPCPPPLLALTKTSRGQTLGGNMDGFKVGSNITINEKNVSYKNQMLRNGEPNSILEDR